MLKIVHDHDVEAPDGVELDELCRLAAQEMLAVTLLAERRAYLDAHAEVLDAAGRRLVVGNGFLPSREVTTAAGRVVVTAPRVHDPREGVSFTSGIPTSPVPIQATALTVPVKFFGLCPVNPPVSAFISSPVSSLSSTSCAGTYTAWSWKAMTSGCDSRATSSA